MNIAQHIESRICDDVLCRLWPEIAIPNPNPRDYIIVVLSLTCQTFAAHGGRAMHRRRRKVIFPSSPRRQDSCNLSNKLALRFSARDCFQYVCMEKEGLETLDHLTRYERM